MNTRIFSGDREPTITNWARRSLTFDVTNAIPLVPNSIPNTGGIHNVQPLCPLLVEKDCQCCGREGSVAGKLKYTGPVLFPLIGIEIGMEIIYFHS